MNVYIIRTAVGANHSVTGSPPFDSISKASNLQITYLSLMLADYDRQ